MPRIYHVPPAKIYYITHNFSDFDSETKHMTRNQRAIYLDLRTLYFTTADKNNGSIDDDFDMLCYRLSCHSDDDKVDLRKVLTDKFKMIGKRYRHSDWDAQIKNIRATMGLTDTKKSNAKGSHGNGGNGKCNADGNASNAPCNVTSTDDIYQPTTMINL